MIAEDFSFDTTRIKTKLQWQPKLTNEQMLLKAYQYFASNKQEIFSRSQASSHRRPAKMGVIRLLKWAS
jgi:UDP-glucose 4-epimerase